VGKSARRSRRSGRGASSLAQAGAALVSLALAGISCGARSPLFDGIAPEAGARDTTDAGEDGGESFDASADAPLNRPDTGATDTGAIDSGAPGDSGRSDACTVDCTPGAIAPPRLIAPLSTATATSQRPLLHWALATGEDGAEVEICPDRACTTRLTRFVASGSSGAPPAALAKGVYFWRVRGRANGITGKRWSPAWELLVGARTAPNDTSWGTTLDVNGDGFPEILVGAFATGNNVGSVYLFMGSSTGPAQIPVTLSSQTGVNGLFGTSVASAGDVNGDGFADVIVGARGVAGQHISGAAYVYLGGESGLSSTPTPLDGPSAHDAYFGASVSSAGDVNGDGYADVVIGAWGESTAYLYFGGAGGIATTGVPLVNPVGGGQFGIAVASAGDVNGDGFADVLVGANRGGATGDAFLYLGAPGGVSASPATIPGPPAGLTLVNFGYALASAGDVNGDGLADVVIGSASFENGGGGAVVYLGSAKGVLTAPTTLFAPGVDTIYFGESVSSAGDVNGDGYGDVVVANGANQVTGSAFLYLGGPNGVASSQAWYAYVGGSLGTTVSGAGDVNGDGLADILVGAPSGGPGNGVGSVTLFFGGASAFSTIPARTLASPTGTYGQFGVSVASVAPAGARRRHAPYPSESRRAF
jgi:hypothetical protein